MDVRITFFQKGSDKCMWRFVDSKKMLARLVFYIIDGLIGYISQAYIYINILQISTLFILKRFKLPKTTIVKESVH